MMEEGRKNALGYLMFSDKSSINLFPLQWIATIKLRADKNKCVYVFDETGAGKTISAGNCILNCIVENRQKDVNILIVCPMNLTLNWYNKLILHYGIEFKLWGNSASERDRYYLDKEGSNLVICSYDASSMDSRTALDYIAEQTDFAWDLVVLDEVHNTKGELRNNKIISLQARKCLAATATPITNDWEELRKIIFSTHTITGSYEEGEAVYQHFIHNKEDILFNCNESFPFTRNFKEIISGQDAKKREIIKIPYEISAEQRNLFWEKLNGATNPLEYFQNYSNMWLVNGDDLEPENDQKLLAFKELVVKICKEGRKSIVFCRRKDTVQYLQHALEELNIRCKGITAGSFQTIDERKRFIQNTNKKATSEAEYEVIITIDSLLNEGYDMTSFDTVINYEMPFKPADLEQRFGRVDRLNSTKKEIYMYQFKNTTYPNEFDGAFQNILDEKLLRHVLTYMPSKSLFDGKTIESLVKNVYVGYRVYRELEQRLEQEYKKEGIEPDINMLRLVIEEYKKKIIGLQFDKEDIFVEGYINKALSVIWYEMWTSKKSCREIITEGRKEKEKTLKDIFGEIPTRLEDVNDTLTEDFVAKFSKSVVWVGEKGIVSSSLDDIKNRIFSETSGYSKVKEEVDMILKEVRLFIEEMLAKDKITVIREIWRELEETDCNYSYCNMVFYNLWRSCFNDMKYEDYIETVNEVIYEG